MIVVLDTNALHGDIHAQGQGLTTLFEACESGLLADTTVWTPQGVVGELVRQFGERAQRMRKFLGEISHDLSSFRIERPDVPASGEAGAEAYRKQLSERLTGPGRIVAPHPSNLGRAIDWAAAHSGPIKPHEDASPHKGQQDLRAFAKPKTRPIYGVVDAAVWMTVVDAAKQGPVAVITSNTSDFADPANPANPCAGLVRELEAAGCNPQQVKIYRRVSDFTSERIDPAQNALKRATEFLDDAGKLEAFKAEVADAIEWFPLDPETTWTPVELDDITLAAFDPSEVKIERADPSPDGIFMTAWVSGSARVDLGIRKGDAFHIPDESPIHVYNWDWNDAMVAAEAELPARLLIEATISDDGRLVVSVEEVQFDA